MSSFGWRLAALILTFWLWIPLMAICELVVRPIMLAILQLWKNISNCLKFFVLIVIFVVFWSIIGFLFIIYSFVQCPINLKAYFAAEEFGNAIRALIWEEENKMQNVINQFFDNMKIGSSPEAAGYQPV